MGLKPRLVQQLYMRAHCGEFVLSMGSNLFCLDLGIIGLVSFGTVFRLRVVRSLHMKVPMDLCNESTELVLQTR